MANKSHSSYFFLYYYFTVYQVWVGSKSGTIYVMSKTLDLEMVEFMNFFFFLAKN